MKSKINIKNMTPDEIDKLAQEKYQLDLSGILYREYGEAFQAYLDGDASGLLCCISNDNYSNNYLDFVIENKEALTKRGIFECAITEAFSSPKRNNVQFSPMYLQYLFTCGEKNKYRQAGDELPEGDIYTIYRGVAGKRNFRHVRGLSWTSSIECACWFATRYEKLLDPAIYRAKVKREDVYCYLHEEKGRGEFEFVCRPESVSKMKLSLDKMRELSSIWENNKKAELQKELEAYKV